MDNQIDTKINPENVRDDGKTQCSNCKCWRTPSEFIGKSGKTVKTCQKCRDKDDKKKMTDAVKEKRYARNNENKYYIKSREKKRAENEEEYLAHNAKLAREWRQRQKEN
jgi:predicted sulfurtransferase